MRFRRRPSTDEPQPQVFTKSLELGSRSVTVASSDPDDEYFASHFGNVPSIVPVAEALVGPDATVFDVGANIGVCSAVFGTLASAGAVHAFEPGTRAARDLRTTVELNHLHNVTCHEVALGAEDGTTVLLVPKWNTSGSFVATDTTAAGLHADNPDVDSVEVAVRSLDSIVDELGVDRIDLLKIDVEGHEDAVLAGATRTLERLRPTCFIEFNPFTLSVFASRNPLEFLVDVLDRFPHVLAISADGVVQVVDHVSSAYHVANRSFNGVGVVDLLCGWDEIAPESVGTPGRF